MGSIFGNNDAKKAARKQAKEARRVRQTANEESARERQRAERGSGAGGGSSSRGRDMLIGNLSNMLKSKLGE